MPGILRNLTVILGAVWFIPISCTTAMIVGYPLVAQSYERQMDKGEAPHQSLFYVVWQPGAGRDAFGFSALANLAPAEKSPARSFIMEQPAGRIEGGRGDVYAYKVLSSGASEQLIEVAYSNATYESVSRYRATPLGITPVFSKVSAPDILIKALLIAFTVAAGLFVAGRLMRSRLSRAKAESDAAPSALPPE